MVLEGGDWCFDKGSSPSTQDVFVVPDPRDANLPSLVQPSNWLLGTLPYTTATADNGFGPDSTVTIQVFQE